MTMTSMVPPVRSGPVRSAPVDGVSLVLPLHDPAGDVDGVVSLVLQVGGGLGAAAPGGAHDVDGAAGRDLGEGLDEPRERDAPGAGNADGDVFVFLADIDDFGGIAQGGQVLDGNALHACSFRGRRTARRAYSSSIMIPLGVSLTLRTAPPATPPNIARRPGLPT